MTEPKKLEKEPVSIINRRLVDEFDAFYFYRSASNWCYDEGYMCAAHFFECESKSELEHAAKLELFLKDWNVLPTLPTIKAPEQDFSSLVDIIEKAYEIEYDLYESYEDDIKKLTEVDLCTFFYLSEFLKIQLASMAEYSNMLRQLNGIDTKDKSKLLFLEKRLFKEYGKNTL
jgi:ferritin